jgi:hypothetical protein
MEKRICDLLRAGNTRKTSAEASGIDNGTFLNWLRRFSDFSSAVTRAEAEAEASYATVLATAARPHDVVETRTITKPDGTVEVTETRRREFDWRAAESWLKRRRREEWGDNAQVTADVEIRDTSALDALKRRLLPGAGSAGNPEATGEPEPQGS